MTIIGATNIQFFKVFFRVRAKRLCDRLFPGKKMSALGKFKRNVLTLDDTFKLALFFSCGAIVNVILNYILIAKSLESFVTFQIKSFFWVGFLDLSLTYITFKLFLTDIPSRPKIPRITKFYVTKPSLEPRRPKIDLNISPDNASTSLEPFLVKEKSQFQFNYIKSTKEKGHREKKDSHTFGDNLVVFKKVPLPPIQ